MAAKPPKPPGNFLKSLLNQHNNNKNQQQQLQHNNEDDDIIESSSSGQAITSTETIKNPAYCNAAITPAIEATAKRTNCNCSNISIMHLFHEMKQEFPTIPDTIVAQCVNENCHQRENCIQMLRNELELNPIPAQSYPAKVLHPPNNNNTTNHINNSNNNNNSGNTTTLQKPPLQQKPIVVQQKPPLKPIKPIRTAPLQPPSSSSSSAVQQSNNNCAKTNAIFAKNTKTTNKQLAGGEDIANNEGGSGGGGGGGPGGQLESNDMPTKITPQYKQSIATSTVNSTTTTAATATEVNNNDNVCVGEPVERNLPRQRPTTLNLNTQLQKQQQQQRQRLNVQLQQRFQEQRNRQQQQQHQQQPQNPTIITKPLRKAPLPPIAPKPSHYQLTNHTNTNTNAVNSGFLNDSLSSPNHTTTTTTTSPLSESEISVSVSLSTPSPTSPNTTTTHRHPQQQHLQTKSPIRHRSVITLQPEPPYTRDFLFTPALITSSTTPSSPSLAAPPNTTALQTTANSSSSANSSPTASVAGSQKSYTSVNLTLRPPVSPTSANPALQPSTIDITAGPGFSGASGGGKSLHYSSTSYDARLGYQQNFQITVTDEGGVFSACRLRPQQQQQHQQQQQRCLNQQLQLQQQFHNNNVVALQQNIQNSIQSPHGVGSINTSSGFGGSGGISGNMCLPPDQAVDAPTQEILQRQKKKRDKLAAALREYKKRFGNVEQEINLLTGTIPTEGLSERLDEEITKLRRDCNDMLRSSNSFTQAPSQQELAINHQPQQPQPQPFPRQRLTQRPLPRPPPPRQTSLDIIQHHSPSSTPHTPPAASLPNLNIYNSPQQQHQQQQQQQLIHTNSPTYLHQQSEPLINNNTTLYTDHSYYGDQEEPLVNDDDGEYEEIVEPQWECNMCTFRNHPQLNICETCDNVRPGMLTNLSRALSATNCTTNTAAAPAGAAASSSASASNLGLLGGASGGGSNNALNNSNSSSRSGLNTANGNLEHDLVQQQLQHFALHT
ncbi:transcription factor SPT20 homolog isoform X2 [Calliphora vicina]|uniref:transcription factor SPT20 homolog isoform X2 n=1 Tax=Calliphora vicina TaxID=7373 RepID=UPI00325BFBC4